MAVIVVAGFAGTDIAKYAGPYLVILAAAMVGVGWGLMRRPDAVPRWHALGLVLLLSAVSLLFTGAVAAAIEIALLKFGWSMPSRYLLAPVSFAIAAVGNEWPKVALWAVGLFKRRAEKTVGGE